MRTQTRHVTSRIAKQQIEELDRISREENLDRSSVLRKVLDIGIKEYAKRKAMDEYRRGTISVGKAAEEARVSLAEFYLALERENVPIKIDLEALED